jgi:DNA invertase Pin-like site-specific DNA recombinase
MLCCDLRQVNESKHEKHESKQTSNPIKEAGSAQGDSAEDQLLVQFQGMIAEYERAQILERSRRGKRHRAQAGEVSVGMPPRSAGDMSCCLRPEREGSASGS